MPSKSSASLRNMIPTSSGSRQDSSSLFEVEAYLASVPEPARATLLQLRETIRAAAPDDATEELGYGVPAFRYRELLAGYAAGKRFCSYYPMSGRVIHDLNADLDAYETTKGAIHFPLDKPLPAALVKKLVAARLAQIEAAPAKSRRRTEKA